MPQTDLEISCFILESQGGGKLNYSELKLVFSVLKQTFSIILKQIKYNKLAD